MSAVVITRTYAGELSPDLSERLLAVEAAAPTRTGVVERSIPRPGLDLATHDFLRPDDAVFVAREHSGQVLAYAVSKLRRATLEGNLVTFNYLAHLRVLPWCRRQGIGHSLLQARLSYGEEAGAVVHWASVEAGNQPSLANLHKAGFVEGRPIGAVGFPIGCLARLREVSDRSLHTVATQELEEACGLLNRFYESYNFWSPMTGDDMCQDPLACQCGYLGFDPQDFFAVRDGSGTMRAVALVYDQAQVERRVVQEIGIPAVRLLARLEPLLALSPVGEAIPRVGRDYPKLFLHYFAATDRESAYSLLRGIAREWLDRGEGWPIDRRAVMLVCQDDSQLFGVRAGITGLVGFIAGKGAYSSQIHTLVKTAQPVSPDRPWWLNFWT